MSIELRLDRADRVYRPGDLVRGAVLVNGRGSTLAHEGLSVGAEGTASLQLSAKSVGLLEAFYTSIKPVELLTWTKDLKPAGKLPEGETAVPFEFTLEPIKGEALLETYHGVFINMQYVVTAQLKRGMLSKALKRSVEFVVEAPEPGRTIKPQPAPFTLVPESLENVKKSSLHHIPAFKISGRLDSVLCSISAPLTGHITIDDCSATIKSIELQLVRVETCSYADGMMREATEIQNVQIADGPVAYGWQIPIHMVYPRLFTCPTVSARTFKVEFEVNLVFLFTDGHLLTENFPVKLVRM